MDSVRLRRPACVLALASALFPSGSGADPIAARDPVPWELGCLARHYAGRPAWEAGAWRLVLPDGTVVEHRRPGARTFAERLDDPDAADLFAIPYRGGWIAAVTDEDHDPGRIRIERLLAATYGQPPASRDLVRGRFLGAPVRIHRLVAPALARVEARLSSLRGRDPSAFAAIAPFLRSLGGSFHDRRIAGTLRRSAHAYGIAIDLNAALGDYWRWDRGGGWRNRVPQAIVDAFEAEGFAWGGRWAHFDTMHFEYRPELLDPACRPGR